MKIEILVGWVGAIGLLVSYFLVVFKIWSTEQVTYKLINFISAILLIINAIYIKALPFLLINIIWAIVAFLSIFRDLNKKTF
jgi:hypothetical protein